ncbi:nuclear transport factor 2 family protein [Streptomyces sp. NPDC048643]|uniref:nuclear transport factor 2 family protein n=1 Tax=Streptomyces sp. NPDC048643 TaxID=3155637 RepID=UPI003445698F
MPHDQHPPIDPAELPPVVTRYLAAHRDRDTATALTTLTDDASVTDDGTTHEGTSAIADWLGRAASEYTYTTELTAAHRTDATHYTATHHLAGDFPGGQVDLRFRFTLRDDLIERLVIAP